MVSVGNFEARSSKLEARSSKLEAQSYLRISHINHPATNTPPTNMAKQYAPYRICSRAPLFCVIPKTIEVNSANTTAAEK